MTGLRLAILALVAVGIVAGAGAYAVTRDHEPPPLPAPLDPLLPDLAMGPIEDISIGVTADGEARLRFAATIVNLGAGEFRLRASRPLPLGSDWDVRQLIAERDGGYTERATGAALVFGGDGHDHWHVEHVEAHQLETLDGEIVGRLVKQGFCFFDTDAYRTMPGSPTRAHWGSRGCAGQLDTKVRMGLSIGWGDKYPWHLLDERIDVTRVPDGEYVIRQIADPNGAFRELDESNNETWVRVAIFTTAEGFRDVRVVEAGPSP